MATMSGVARVFDRLRASGQFSKNTAPSHFFEGSPEARRAAFNELTAEWMETFEDVSDDALLSAYRRWKREAPAKSLAFMPKSAEVYRYTAAASEIEDGPHLAEAAWGECVNGICTGTAPGEMINRHLAAARSPDHPESDPVYGVRWVWSGTEREIAAKQFALTSCGGFDALREKLTNQTRPGYRRQFREAFIGFLKRSRTLPAATLGVPSVAPRPAFVRRPRQLPEHLDAVIDVEVAEVVTENLKRG